MICGTYVIIVCADSYMHAHDLDLIAQPTAKKKMKLTIDIGSKKTNKQQEGRG